MTITGQELVFEVDSTGKCTAVLVHTAGDSTLAYLNMKVQNNP